MRIVLASTSPRRKELLEKFNIPFEIITEKVDESFDGNDNIYEQSMEIAKRKAEVIFRKTTGDVIVIGSDTIVVYDNKIYGKPKNYQDAVNMLSKFSDSSHEVISSLCVLVRKGGKEYVELTYDKCIVYVDKLSLDEIDEWIGSNDVYSKAGAYAIQ